MGWVAKGLNNCVPVQAFKCPSAKSKEKVGLELKKKRVNRGSFLIAHVLFNLLLDK